MAFLCRMRLATKLRFFTNHFKISAPPIPTPSHLLSNPESTSVRLRYTLGSAAVNFPKHVRFFAAPVQVKPKQETKDPTGPRLNEKIKADIVRLVTDEGHLVLSRMQALQRASELKLDLVEVDRNAKPPVCKIMDYNREKYKKQLKDKDRVKNKSEVKKGVCKEVRFNIKTEQKDLVTKANTIKRLMERGYRVKCMATGTEEHDLGGLLSRLSALIDEISFVESGPRVEKQQAYMVVRHIKFGPSKKGGSAKKASKVVNASTSDIEASPNSDSSTLIEDEEIGDQSEVETDDEYHLEEQLPPISVCAEENPLVIENRYKKENPPVSENRYSRENPPILENRYQKQNPLSIENRYKRETSPVLENRYRRENPPVFENRYKRDHQNNPNAPDPRERTSPFPQFPNRQPEHISNVSPPIPVNNSNIPQYSNRQPEFRPNVPPSFGNSRFPGSNSNVPQFSSQNPELQPNMSPRFDNSRSPANNSNMQEKSQTRAAGYGIFSAPNVSSTFENNGGTTENRFSKVNNFYDAS